MAALKRKVERAGLLRNLGPCCKALCARRDIAIRRQLLKNEKVRPGKHLISLHPPQHVHNKCKPGEGSQCVFPNSADAFLSPSLQGLTKQMYPSVPVVDNELLQLSVRLFKKTVASQAAGQDKLDSGPPATTAPAAATAAAAAVVVDKPTAQPEVSGA